MPVTITKIESLRRISVTGDPSTYTNVPCSLVPGDVVYREDGALSFLMTDAGLVAGTSLDESPIFTTATVTNKFASTTALATPDTLAATAFNAFASTVSGAVLMGFGTTNDVTLMNRAGTPVIGITANTTGVTMAGALAVTGATTLTGGVTGPIAFTTLLSSVTALATPSALAATAFNAFASTVSGATLMGFGTTGDVTLKNRAGTTVAYVGPNTTGFFMVGAVDIGGGLSVTTSVTVGASSAYAWATRSRMESTADGVVVLYNAASNDFGSLAFGGASSSFPAIKRSSAKLQFRLADDSTYASLDASTGFFDGNVLVGGSVGATANRTVALSNSATAPTTSVDLVHLYSADITAGHASLAIYSEETVNAAVAAASTHRLPITINGTQYAILLTTVLA
jgi:hypothetical protein